MRQNGVPFLNTFVMGYLEKQIITYMGNKRKVLPHIETIVQSIQIKLNKPKS